MNIYIEREGKKVLEQLDADGCQALETLASFLVATSRFVKLDELTQFLLDVGMRKRTFYELKFGPYILTIFS